MGWVIYRTTYSDDGKWKRFNEIFQRQARKDATEYWGLDDHLQYLDFPVWEDAKLFKDATTAAIRKHFLAWSTSDKPFEEQGLDPQEYRDFDPIFWSPRYNFFIHVDEEAMESVLALAESERRTGYVNVVEADWPPSAGDGLSEEDAESERRGILSDCGYPEVEGMDTWEVGFQRVAVNQLYPSHYRDVHGLLKNIWYVRPPKITD
jgi:hypothetical protein